MKKRILTGFMAMILTFPMFSIGASAQAGSLNDTNIMRTFYVSPNGDDSASGTKNEPFKTLEKARSAVDKINDDMTGDIIVYLMDGTWELDKTLKFGKSDSGTNGYFVRYEAAEGANPVISGGKKLNNGWSLHDSSKDIYKMSLNRNSKLRALYVNGERSYMAQTETPISAQGSWGSYAIGGTSDDDYDWDTVYTEDFDVSIGENGDAIQKYAITGPNENAVLNLVEESDGNRVIQIGHTANDDCGFEIPDVKYKTGLITFKIKFGAEHEFTHEWEALHMHAATGDDANWAGVKLAPHLSSNRNYFQTCTDGTISDVTDPGTQTVSDDTWYDVKMLVTDGAYYTKLWKTGENEPESWMRADHYSGLDGKDKFFRMYAYKHDDNSSMDIRVDDICIQSGTFTGGDASTETNYSWEEQYKEDFDFNGTIQKYAIKGPEENAVVDFLKESDENYVIRIGHTANDDCGFEIPDVKYKTGLITFKIKFGAEHEFTHEWEALHMHAATGDDANWAGVKLAPHLSENRNYFQTCTDGMISDVTDPGTQTVSDDTWYDVKMLVTDGVYYTKLWKTGENEPESWMRADHYSGLDGKDKFFRMYAYKHDDHSSMDIRIDDICIKSGTKRDGSDNLPDWAWTTGIKFDGILYNKDDLALISKNVTDVEIENQQTWNKNTVCVRDIEDNGDGKWILKLQQPYGAIAQTPGWNTGLQGSGSHVIKNAYEFLDKPGEFYFDREGKTLYYIPRKNEDLEIASVVVPQLETILSFEGTPVVSGDLSTAGEKQITGQVKNIIFNGISIAHSDWNLQEVDGSYGKSTVQAGTVYTAFASGNCHADMYRNMDTIPGAVEMEFAHNIKILNGEIKLTGAEGVIMSNDVDGCEVTGNYIYQTGGGGVVVGNPQHIYENDSLESKKYYYKYVPGDGKPEVSGDGAAASHEKYQGGTERVPRDVKISNNLLVENCRLFPAHCPITSFFSQKLEVSNNFIKDAAYSGMNIGWGWANFDGTEGGFTDWGVNNNQGGSILPGIPTNTCFENTIVNNRIDTVMTILNDGGQIYTLGKQEGTVIAGNFVKDSKNHGLYTDEGSAYFKPIENNVIKNVNDGVIWAPDYGRKHDLLFRNNYYNNGGIDVPSAESINIRAENFQQISDCVWPKAASDIVQNSGLTSEYRKMFAQKYEGLYGTTADALLPESASLKAGEPLVLNAWLDQADEIWLAPAGTTVFAEGKDMVKAAGNASEIDTKALAGEYHLYVKTGDTYSEASEAVVKVEGSLESKVLMALNSSGQYTADSAIALQAVYDKYLVGEEDEAELQAAYDSLKEYASYELYYEAPAEVENVTSLANEELGFTKDSIVDNKIEDMNGWHSAGNTTDAYITIDLQTERTITELMIAPRPGYEKRLPKECDIYVSDTVPAYNGAEISDLDEKDKVASVSFTSGGYEDAKALPDNTVGRYVTIHVKNVQNEQNDQDRCINVSEIAMCLLDSAQPYIALESVELNQTNLELKVKDTAQLNAAVNPQNATIRDLTWSSSDEEIATVDADGKVTAVSEGEAIITVASKNGIKSTCTVKVKAEDQPGTDPGTDEDGNGNNNGNGEGEGSDGENSNTDQNTANDQNNGTNHDMDKEGNIAETGDTANPVLWIVLLGVSAALAACGAVYYRHKH